VLRFLRTSALSRSI